MGIGSVTSWSGMSNMQMTMVNSESKKVQDEITGVQQQKQKVSSNVELSVDEKANEREKLQKELSNLNAELKQYQEELRKAQRKEIMMAEQQADDTEEENKEKVIVDNEDGVVILKEETDQNENRGVETEKIRAEEIDETKEGAIAEKARETDSDVETDTRLSHEEVKAIVSANHSVQQAERQGTVITKMKDGMVILKGEISQDERRGVDTEKKQAELEKMQKKEQRATTFQFSVLGGANNTMKSAVKAKVSETDNRKQTNTENNALINALRLSGEEAQISQQRFNISFG